MKHLGTFLFGLLVGGAVTFAALKFHIVRASDGIYTVPKVTAQLKQTYVDIRGFDLNDWNEHRSLAVALVQADKGHLVQQAAGESFRETINGIFEGLSGKGS